MTTFCSRPGGIGVQLPGEEGFEFDRNNHGKPCQAKTVNITDAASFYYFIRVGFSATQILSVDWRVAGLRASVRNDQKS